MLTVGTKLLLNFLFCNLKEERIKKRIYKTREVARADVFDYIEGSTLESGVIRTSMVWDQKYFRQLQSEAI